MVKPHLAVGERALPDSRNRGQGQGFERTDSRDMEENKRDVKEGEEPPKVI